MNSVHPGPPPVARSRRQLLSLSPPAATPRADHWLHVHRPAMACRFEITLSGDRTGDLPAAVDALAEADRLESALSVFRDASAISGINRNASDGPVTIDRELYALLDRCRTIHHETDGAFDITTTPLSRCWGFLTRQPQVPDALTLAAARASVGLDAVDLDARDVAVRFSRPGVELNLGSIGKGFAVDAIAAALHARGVRHALISAGGSSVRALGGHAGGWPVDIYSRQSARGCLAKWRLTDCAMATSGAGEQFIEIDGRRFAHILDPRTGRPADSRLISVTVVADDAALADALATAFFIGGQALAERYCATHPRTLVLLVSEDTPAHSLVGSHPGVRVDALAPGTGLQPRVDGGAPLDATGANEPSNLQTTDWGAL